MKEDVEIIDITQDDESESDSKVSSITTANNQTKKKRSATKMGLKKSESDSDSSLIDFNKISNSNVILLVQDEDENDNHNNKNDCSQDKDSIQNNIEERFTEITNCYDRIKCRRILKQYNYNLEQSLSATFRDDADNHNHNHNATDGNHNHSHADKNILILAPIKEWYETVTSCKSAGIPFLDPDFPPESCSLDGRKVVGIGNHNIASSTSANTSTSTSTSTESSSSGRNHGMTCTTTHIPSKRHFNPYAKHHHKKNDHNQNNQHATKASPVDTSTTNSTTINRLPKCHCGYRAISKSVQKDGPNFGRYFLSCGMPRSKLIPKRGPETDLIVVVEKENDNQNQKINNKLKQRKTGVKCKFFQWDDYYYTNNNNNTNNNNPSSSSSYSSSQWTSKITWKNYGILPQYTLLGTTTATTSKNINMNQHYNYCNINNNKNNNNIPHHHFHHQSLIPGPHHVQQGSLGNCWFLSALAAISERPYLVQNLLPTSTTYIPPSSSSSFLSPSILQDAESVGCYQINLYLNGKWTPILIDGNLPVMPLRTNTSSSKSKDKAVVITKSKNDDNHIHKSNNKNNQIIIPTKPAFAAVPNHRLWPALVEKAYAKAHGSYHHLSGGYIDEALNDLSGAPTERIHFHHHNNQHQHHVEELWARLLSFSTSKFVMGVATNGGDGSKMGLVPCHAYSILDVLELHNVVWGEQSQMTDFYLVSSNHDNEHGRTPHHHSDRPTATTTISTATLSPFHHVENHNDEEVIVLGCDQNNRHDQDPHGRKKRKQTLRLIRIRNPWGCREWKGAWSANSDLWTPTIRKAVGETCYKKGDGTFFMSFEDVMLHFDHLDVAKCRAGWVNTSHDCTFRKNITGDPLLSSTHIFLVSTTEKTWGYISIVQPKKRALTQSKYWYTDISLVILRKKKDSSSPVDGINTSRKLGHKFVKDCNAFGRNTNTTPTSNTRNSITWEGEQCLLRGVQRQFDVEVFLDPDYQYLLLPFSHSCGSLGDEDKSQGSTIKERRVKYRLATYSSSIIQIQKLKNEVKDNTTTTNTTTTTFSLSLIRNAAITYIHSTLLACKAKITYVIGSECVLLAIRQKGIIYYMTANASLQRSTRLHLTIGNGQNNSGFPRGSGNNIAIVFGENSDTHSIPSQSQSIILVLLVDTRSGGSSGCDSMLSSVHFSYRAESFTTTRPSFPRHHGNDSKSKCCDVGQFHSKIALSIFAEFLLKGVNCNENEKQECQGKCLIDEDLWNAVRSEN